MITKKVTLLIMAFFISLNVMSQDSPLDQTYRKGEELFNKKDYKKAFSILVDAAKQNHAGAQFLVGKMYYFGYYVKKNVPEAIIWYQKSAAQGYGFAQNNLGFIYLKGDGVPRDLDKAFSLISKAAEKDIAIAQCNLGSMYLHGEGVDKDPVKAMNYFMKSANLNCSMGMRCIALMYEFGNGITKDYREALNWHKKAANLGDSLSMAKIGMFYEYGYGVNKDYREAFNWYSKSANNNCPMGLVALAYMYRNGSGVKQDYSEAFRLFKMAAEQGDAVGQYCLGLCYENGDGITKSYSKALEWYKKSVDQDYAPAQTSLAMMYTYGKGVKQDYREAAWLFRQAALKGDGQAQTFLGVMLEEGNGVTKNLEEAAEWFRKALETNPNDKYAKEGLSRVSQYVTSPSTTNEEERISPQKKDSDNKMTIDASGSGFIIDKRGYLATNYHVTEGAKDIYVCLPKEGEWASYHAIVVKDDPINDLSIIRIDDDSFKPYSSLPYNFKTETEDVASDIYVLGYPRVLVMGTEVKYTTGTINSKTGIQGDPTHYQISAHTDHGNSGGPLFNSKGAIIGITDSGLDKAKYGDVNYAIKSSYLKSLVDALPIKLELPHDTSIEKLSRVEQIKVLSKYTALILIDLP